MSDKLDKLDDETCAAVSLGIVASAFRYAQAKGDETTLAWLRPRLEAAITIAESFNN